MEVELHLPTLFVPPGFIKQDICTLIQNTKLAPGLLYFPPKYTHDEKGRLLLFDDLLRAAQKGGDCLTLWGKGTGKNQSMYIRCQCGILYRGNKVDTSTGSIVGRSDYRNTTYCNDSKNNRPGRKGINGSHRTDIDRRLSKDTPRCPFSLSVFHDAKDYFIKSSSGCVLHQFHARRDHLRAPTTLLDDSQKQILQDLHSARAKTGTAANLHYVRTGRKSTPTILSRDQIKGLVKKNSRSKNDNDIDKEGGEIDDLYHFLEESGNFYVSLLARTPEGDSDVPGKPILFNETCIGQYTGQEDVHIAADEEQQMVGVVSDHRRLLKIDDSKEMMVGIAYAMPFEIKQFELFHVCMHIDATADSNKEGRPLVTVSSKDSYGKMFIVLRAFLPNEQSWAYKWLFQTVFPALLGNEVMKKVKVLVTDGDSQEISQLDDAATKFFPNAHRIRCSWHIIDRGWHKKVKVNLGGKSTRKRALHLRGNPRQAGTQLNELNKTARTIYRWMFSWAQPSYCETEEEYFVSKALFMMFVRSSEVKEILGIVPVKAIIKFARENVFPCEDRMSYFKRHDLFHLETHTNCGHEGTNNGMKNCSSPVMPQNRLDRAVQTLNLNAQMKAGNTSIKVCRKANSKKTWATSPTAEHVTDPCESMLQTEWSHAFDWIPHRTAQHRWLVIHRLDRKCSSLNEWSEGEDSVVSESNSEVGGGSPTQFGLIPRFTRVREVTVKKDSQVFSCSCCHQERMGMPCRHIGSICLSNNTILGDDPKGFPLSSIRVFWWNQYYLYGTSTKLDHQKSRMALLALANQDTEGLPCPPTLDNPRLFSYPDEVFYAFCQPPTDRLLNYDCTTARSAVQLLKDRNNPNQITVAVPAGLSQISHLPNQSDCESGFGEWGFGVEELSETEFYSHSRQVLSRHFNEVTEAINNSREKQELETEMRIFLSNLTARARGVAAGSSTSTGSRVSMLPTSSKRRKTHGTKHY